METVEITGLTHDGRGVGRLNGQAIFIAGALPGETVKAGGLVQHKRYCTADLVEIMVPSPSRCEPVCPVFGTCGGCQLQNAAYEAQLAFKRQIVEDALARIGGLLDFEVAPVIPSPETLHYRNRVTLHVEPGQGSARLGYFQEETHCLFPVSSCPLGPKVLDELIPWMSGTWPGEMGPGRVTVRQGKEVLMCVLEGVEIGQEAQAWASRMVGETPVDSVWAVSRGGNKHLAGDQDFTYAMLGVEFAVSPTAFTQVNDGVAALLYEKVLALVAAVSPARAAEAYCGIGVLAQFMARQAKKVFGLEVNPAAVKDARRNAAARGIQDLRFLEGPCEATLPGILGGAGGIDLLVVDPPRAGLSPEVAAAICRHQVDNLIYVSCNPATLARDLSRLCGAGYAVNEVQPFDMFPQTAHVECVVLLKRKRSE